MKKKLKQILQTRKNLIFLLSFTLVFLIDFFVVDWQFKIIGFFLVLLIDNLLLYRFTNYFSETGIFILSSYNFVSNLFWSLLISLVIYCTQAVRPDFEVILLLLIFHMSWK